MNNLLVYLITCWLCNIQETTVKSCTVEWSLLIAPLQTCCQIWFAHETTLTLHCFLKELCLSSRRVILPLVGSRLYHLQTDITWPLASLFTCHCRCCRSRAQCMKCKILPLLRNWSLKTECDGWFYMQHYSTLMVIYIDSLVLVLGWNGQKPLTCTGPAPLCYSRGLDEICWNGLRW